MNKSDLTKQILENLKDIDKKPNTPNTPTQDKKPETPSERKPLNESDDGHFSHEEKRDKVRWPQYPDDKKPEKK